MKLLLAVAISMMFTGCGTVDAPGDNYEVVAGPQQPIEVEPVYTNEELELLACVIYQEAGGNASCDDCRRMVADVVLNRVSDERFPNTILGVLLQPGQYGSYSRTGVVWPARADNPNEYEAVQRAYRTAKEVLEGQHSELYGEGYVWQAKFIQGYDVIGCCGHYYGK